MKSFYSITLFENADACLCSTKPTWFQDEERLLFMNTELNTVLAKLTSAKTIALEHQELSIWLPKLLYLAEYICPNFFIFACTDISLTNADMEELLQAYPQTICLITNFIGNHPRCKILPLGNITYNETIKEKKQNTFCITYSLPNSHDREEFYDFLKNSPTLQPFMVPQLPREEYNKILSQCYFSVCCCGNGYDTYRFWESLCNGAIPIVKSNIYFERLRSQYPRLPFVCIDTWNDLFTLVPTLTLDLYENLWKKKDISCVWDDYWSSMLSGLEGTP